MRFHHLCGSSTESCGGANQRRRKRISRAFAGSLVRGFLTALRIIIGHFAGPTALVAFSIQLKPAAWRRNFSFFSPLIRRLANSPGAPPTESYPALCRTPPNRTAPCSTPGEKDRQKPPKTPSATFGRKERRLANA